MPEASTPDNTHSPEAFKPALDNAGSKKEAGLGWSYRAITQDGRVVLRAGDTLPSEKVLFNGALKDARVVVKNIYPTGGEIFMLDLRITPKEGAPQELRGVPSNSPMLNLGLSADARAQSPIQPKQEPKVKSVPEAPKVPSEPQLEPQPEVEPRSPEPEVEPRSPEPESQPEPEQEPEVEVVPEPIKHVKVEEVFALLKENGVTEDRIKEMQEQAAQRADERIAEEDAKKPREVPTERVAVDSIMRNIKKDIESQEPKAPNSEKPSVPLVDKFAGFAEERDRLVAELEKGENAEIRETIEKIDDLLERTAEPLAELTDRMEKKNPVKWFTNGTIDLAIRQVINLEDPQVTDEDFTSDVGHLWNSEDSEAPEKSFTMNGFVVEIDDEAEGGQEPKYLVYGPNGYQLEDGRGLSFEAAEKLAKEKAVEHQKVLEKEYVKVAKNFDVWNEREIARLTELLEKEIARPAEQSEDSSANEAGKQDLLESVLLEQNEIDRELAESDRRIEELNAEILRLEAVVDEETGKHFADSFLPKDLGGAPELKPTVPDLELKYKGPAFYMNTSPAGDGDSGYFDGFAKVPERKGISLFECKPTGENEAELYLLSTVRSTALASGDRERLSRAVEFKNLPADGIVTAISVEEPGIIEFDGTKWKVMRRVVVDCGGSSPDFSHLTLK